MKVRKITSLITISTIFGVTLLSSTIGVVSCSIFKKNKEEDHSTPPDSIKPEADISINRVSIKLEDKPEGYIYQVGDVIKVVADVFPDYIDSISYEFKLLDSDTIIHQDGNKAWFVARKEDNDKFIRIVATHKFRKIQSAIRLLIKDSDQNRPTDNVIQSLNLSFKNLPSRGYYYPNETIVVEADAEPKTISGINYSWEIVNSTTEIATNSDGSNAQAEFSANLSDDNKVLRVKAIHNGLSIFQELRLDIRQSPESNEMYGLSVLPKVSEYTKRKISRDAIDLDVITKSITNSFRSSLNDSSIHDFMNQWAQWYVKEFVLQRQSLCTGLIRENNITLNSNKTISGNIRFEFTWHQEMYAPLIAAQRIAGDVEIHNYVFENAPIEAYINKEITNFVSFKINTKYVQRKLIKNSIQGSYNLGFENEEIYLDCINSICLDLENSLFNINLEQFLNNMYSYKIANNESKELIKEIIVAIGSKTYSYYIGGSNPINNLSLTSPVIAIKLKRQYNNIPLNIRLAINDDISALLYFVSNGKPIGIKNGYVYIPCWDTVIQNINSGTLLDLDANDGSKYNDKFLDLQPVSQIYRKNLKVKEIVIANNQDKINKPWLEYLDTLNDNTKASLIYAYLLPFVSYGGMNSTSASNIYGYVDKRVICEGYAHLFSYFAATLNIKSIYITGTVKANAVPGQQEADGLHAWNLIEVNNKWLWCDPTWDDSITPNSPTYNLNNFLKSYKEFFTPDTHLNIINWSKGNDLPSNSK